MTNVHSHRSFACLVALVTAAALAVAAPIASAQTSQGGYTPPGSNVQAEIQETPGTPAGDPAASTATTTTRSGSRASGTLPFTGLDLGLIGLVGAGLVLGGLGLRRMTLRGSSAQQRNAA
jgi:hypothetical protein